MQIWGVNNNIATRKNSSFSFNNTHKQNNSFPTRFQARIVESEVVPDKFIIVGEKVSYAPKEDKFSRQNSIKLRENENKSGYREVIS